MSQSSPNSKKFTLDTIKADINVTRTSTKAFQQTQAMFFPVTSYTPEVLMMDEQDYREHLLLNALEDDKAPAVDCVDTAAYDRVHLSPTPTEETSLIDENDHMEELITSSSLHTKDGNDADDSTSSTTAAVAASSLIKSEPQTESQAIEAAVQSSDSDAKPVAADNNKNSDNSDGATDIPTKFDVLCGQSRICASHSGNKRFQVVLEMYATRYENATSKQEKMTLTKEIVGCITNSGGRFLKYKDGMWQEISTVMARDKVSHALRTKVASWKKQQKEENTATKKTGKPKRAMSVIAATKAKKTHRRRRSAPVAARKRPSSASIKTCFSEGASFDANDSSSNIMDTLLSKQREIFASLTKPADGVNEVHPLKK